MSWQDKEHYARLRAGETPRPRVEFGRDATRAVLVFPNSYFLGMSNLGFQTIYRIANSSRGLLCDRFFPEDWSSSDTALSFECEAPLGDFDVMAFSIAFENDYLNLLRTLDMARVPFRSDQRDDSHPLVVVGGAVTFMNPEPIAEFADVIVMGEAERSAPELFEAVAGVRGRARREMLEAVSGIEGIYVPALSPNGPPPVPDVSVAAAAGGRIEDRHISHSSIISSDTEFSGTFLVEISRGCPYRCRFCAVGNCHPRFRSAAADGVLGVVERRLRSSRARPVFERVGLVSSAVGSHPDLDAICLGLREMGLGVAVSSLRVDRLSDVLLRCLAESGTRTMTIAPEAGSERLRLVAGKDLPEDLVLDGAARAVDRGIPNVKLYFMVGLPTETDEDIEALMELAAKVRKVMDGGLLTSSRMHGAWGGHQAARESPGATRRGSGAGALTVSLAPFVPKPMTPLQWSAMEKPVAVRRKISMIRRGLSRMRGIRVTSEALRSAYLQAMLARGGREMSGFMEETYRRGGDWKRAAAEVGLDADACLGRRGLKDELPWASMVAAGRAQELEWEYRRALSLTKERPGAPRARGREAPGAR